MPPLPPPLPPGKASPAAQPPPPPRPPTAPPPPPAKGGGPPPSARPPPPPLAGAAGGRQPAQQKKLKPLHWEKVNRPLNPDHSMVWDRIPDGSFRFDEDTMEALFGDQAPNRRPPRGGGGGATSSASIGSSTSSSSSSAAAPAAAQICLLDPRRSQNTAIVLRSLPISRQDLLDALLEGRGNLGPDALEKLARIAPTQDEESTIRAFAGDPARLADAESFLFHLLRAVPAPFARASALLFRSAYPLEVAHISASLETLQLACKELRTRGLFFKLLEAVLKAGNRMNAGTARGNAQAFNLTALCKLADVKSTDGSTTLLHFVVEEVVRSEGKRCAVSRNYSLRRSGSIPSDPSTAGDAAARREEREKEYMRLGLPVVGGLSTEFASVKKAASIDYDGLVGGCAALGARLAEIRGFLGTCGGDGFSREMGGFVEAAAAELVEVREQQDRALELVGRTTAYYHAGAAKDKSAPPLQLFMTVRDFLVMVDQACVDITRKMQKKKPPAAAKSTERSSIMGEGEKRVMPRFPNLPAHFMSENSRSDSDEE